MPSLWNFPGLLASFRNATDDIRIGDFEGTAWDPSPLIAAVTAAAMSVNVAHKQLEEAFTGMPLSATLGSASALVAFTVTQRTAALGHLHRHLHHSASDLPMGTLMRSYDVLFVSYFLCCVPVFWLYPSQRMAKKQAEQFVTVDWLEHFAKERERIAPTVIRAFCVIVIFLLASIEPVYTLASQHLAHKEDGEDEDSASPALLLTFLYVMLVWCSLNIIYEAWLDRSLHADFPWQILELLVPQRIRDCFNRCWRQSSAGIGFLEAKELVQSAPARCEEAMKAIDDIVDQLRAKFEAFVENPDAYNETDERSSFERFRDEQLAAPWASHVRLLHMTTKAWKTSFHEPFKGQVLDAEASIVQHVAEDRKAELEREVDIRLHAGFERLWEVWRWHLHRVKDCGVEQRRVVKDQAQMELAFAVDGIKVPVQMIADGVGPFSDWMSEQVQRSLAFEAACFRLIGCTRHLSFLSWPAYSYAYLLYSVSTCVLVAYSNYTVVTLRRDRLSSPLTWLFLSASFALVVLTGYQTFFAFLGLLKQEDQTKMTGALGGDSPETQPLLPSGYASSAPHLAGRVAPMAHASPVPALFPGALPSGRPRQVVKVQRVVEVPHQIEQIVHVPVFIEKLVHVTVPLMQETKREVVCPPQCPTCGEEFTKTRIDEVEVPEVHEVTVRHVAYRKQEVSVEVIVPCSCPYCGLRNPSPAPWAAPSTSPARPAYVQSVLPPDTFSMGPAGSWTSATDLGRTASLPPSSSCLPGVPEIVYEDEVVHVPKLVMVEKLVEIPVQVEKIVQVPMIQLVETKELIAFVGACPCCKTKIDMRKSLPAKVKTTSQPVVRHETKEKPKLVIKTVEVPEIVWEPVEVVVERPYVGTCARCSRYLGGGASCER
mmetsp:Transcript_14865/g.52135  ORF Transcript_14865/g.52135 Transcript_14865/m.52135 type:complete len:882 (+) Transcript_14865:61-2706(+)